MGRLKLIIFDFDGTLADTHELIVQTNQEAARQMQRPVPEEDAISAIIGLPLDEGIRTLFPGVTDQEVGVFAAKYREVFYALRGKFVPALFPGVKETLAALHAHGYVLTVASSRSCQSLNEFLDEMGVAGYISYVLGADNVTRAKPHPEPVLKTLRELGFAPEEALVVGDMPVDIQMGLGAGAFTCGVSYGNSSRAALLASGAHHVIDHFPQLMELL